MVNYNNIRDIINYIIKNKASIRSTANHFNKSKSTLHRWVKKYMKDCDEETYFELVEIFDNNFKTKSTKGGQSFKKKYLGKKRIDIYKNNGYN